MSNLIDNRQIRVFISSTFRDMQDERDYLMKRAFPKLRKLAAERDVTLTELDLRWGITEEESKSGKVVEICLREIENSIPFFIGIIGNRYGWVPEKKDLNDNVTDRFKAVNDYLEHHLSVTEMEMQFGVLAREEDMHAYFFIKEQVEEQDNPEMLQRLKEEVKASKYPSSTYSSPEDLALQVEQAFTDLLNELFPEGELSELEKERIGQRAFMNQLCLNYIKDERIYDVLDKWLANEDSHQFVVTGASGLGKSALIANWLKEKLTDNNFEYNTIYHFTGNGGSESSSEHITKAIANEILDIYGWEYDDLGAEVKLKDLFVRVSAEDKKHLLIVIDAINQIVDVDNAKLLNWLPAATKSIKILFSTLENDRTMEVFKHRGYPIFTLQPLDIERRSQLIINYLKLYAKSLTDKQLERIANDSQCENTLVLKTLLDELINFGIYEKLDERIEYYLSPDTIEDFYQALLRNYEKEFGRQYVRKILSLILTSQYGLKEDEIRKIMRVKKILKWSQFYCSFMNHFVNKNGKINFSHEYIRKAVNKRYIKGNKKWEKSCRNDICLYRYREFTDNAMGHAAFFEIPFQLYMLNNDEELFKWIDELPVLASLSYYEQQNAIRYWERLLSKGYSMDVYKTAKDMLVQAQDKDGNMMWSIVSFFRKFGKDDIICELEEKRLQILMANEDTPSVNLAMAFNNLGNAYLDINDGENDEYYQKSFDYFSKAIEFAQKANSYQPIIVACNGMAELYAQVNDAEEVIRFSNLALELSKKYSKVEVPACLLNLARTYDDLLKDYDKAIQYCLEGLAIQNDREGLISEGSAIFNYVLAHCYLDNGQYIDALDAITEAIRILNEMYDNYHDMDDYTDLQNEIKQHLSDTL